MFILSDMHLIKFTPLTFEMKKENKYRKVFQSDASHCIIKYVLIIILFLLYLVYLFIKTKFLLEEIHNKGSGNFVFVFIS